MPSSCLSFLSPCTSGQCFPAKSVSVARRRSSATQSHNETSLVPVHAAEAREGTDVEQVPRQSSRLMLGEPQAGEVAEGSYVYWIVSLPFFAVDAVLDSLPEVSLLEVTDAAVEVESEQLQAKAEPRIDGQDALNADAADWMAWAGRPLAKGEAWRPSLLFDEMLPDSSIDSMMHVLSGQDTDAVVCSSKEHLNAYDIAMTPWAEAQPVDAQASCSTLARTLHSEVMLARSGNFRIPLPSDVPWAVQQLACLPESASVTVEFHIRRFATDCEESDPQQVRGLTLLLKSNSYGAQFSDCFCVWQFFIFTQLPDDAGVRVRMWADVEWVVPLYWYHNPLVSYVDSKALSGAADSGKHFCQTIERMEKLTISKSM